MDRERGKGSGGWGGGWGGEHERSRQEEAWVGWVIRQIQIGVVV